MTIKRITDFLISLSGLIILSPLFLIIAILIKIESSGPVFFRQVRVGKDETIFRIYKFRTMLIDSENNGPKVTIKDDKRITPLGQYLRKYKLDELPQLINVLSGEMSLVGPRPEVPKFAELYPTPIKKIVFSVRPGITDPASIIFKNENELLTQTSDPENYYTENIMPAKLKYYVEYIENRNLLLDFSIIFRTLKSVFISH
jgi:lipopolysaccharide/colanic/teichoic acid biosynthesis glycosyltransferase